MFLTIVSAWRIQQDFLPIVARPRQGEWGEHDARRRLCRDMPQKPAQLSERCGVPRGFRILSQGVGLALLLAALPARAESYQTLNKEGGMKAGDGIAIYLGDLLRMQVKREGRTQFYPDNALPDADFLNFRLALAVDGVTYGAHLDEDGKFVAVSQSVSGTGTEFSPFVGVTIADVGTTGLRVREEVRYVVPRDVMSIIVDVFPTVDNQATLKLYMGGDTYLLGGDKGAGYTQPATGWPSVVGVTKSAQYMVFVEGNRPFSHYYSAHFSGAMNEILKGGDYSDSIDPRSDTDNGMGVQWNLGVPKQPVRIAYHLGFTTTPSICGNGNLEGFETCDDLGVAEGDGCSSTCQIEPGYRCEGIPSVCAIWCGDGLLRGMEGCDDGNSVDADGCSSVCGVELGWQCEGEPSRCNFALGHSCVSDAECASGWCDKTYEHVCKPLNECGNGLLEVGELCDDGGRISGDGCGPTCLRENGAQCNLDSECESFVCDGGLVPPTCRPLNACGNGRLEASEACDDGNSADGDGCDATCLLSIFVACEKDEDCASSLCHPKTRQCVALGVCGNGLVERDEECDDGLTIDGDGCSAKCTKEAPPTSEPEVPTTPEPNPPVIVDPPEPKVEPPPNPVPPSTKPKSTEPAAVVSDEELIGSGICNVSVVGLRSSRQTVAWMSLCAFAVIVWRRRQNGDRLTSAKRAS